MQDNGNQKSIASLLKELKEMVTLYTKVKVAYECTRAKENIIDGAKTLKETCVETAREFGVNLEDASQKYDNARNGVRQIEEKYRSSLEKLRKEYETRIVANEQERTEAEAERDKWSEKISEVYENRENVKEPEEQREAKENELKKAKKELINAAKKNDFEKAAEYTEKCRSLEKEIKEMEEDYSQKLVPFDETLEKLQEEYNKADEKVEKLEELSEKMEKNFEKECKDAAKVKKQELALVKGNNLLDKVRGFFSKRLLKSINGQKKFQEQFLTPAMNAITSYANQVPEKMKNAREKFEDKVKEITGKSRDALWIAKDVTVETLLGAKEAIEYGATVVKDKAVDIATGTRDAVVHGATVVKDKAVDIATGTRDAVVHGATVVKDKAVDIATGTRDAVVHGATVVKDKAVEVAYGARDVAVGVAGGVAYGAISLADKANAAYRMGTEHVQNKVNEMRNGLADGIINATDKIREKAEMIRPEASRNTKEANEIGEME